MSTSSAPFGLIPAYSPSGVIRPTMYSIVSGYNANIFGNQPVKLTDGQVEPAAIGDEYIGSFQGVEWTDSDGRRRVSNKWTAATSGTQINAYVTLDPSIVYNIQANGTLSAASIGAQYNFTTVTAGNATVGISQVMLDTATSGTNKQMRVIGLTPAPDNAWDDNFPIVQVQVSLHQNVANKAAY